MADENQQGNMSVQARPAEPGPGEELDAAGKSLSEALRISFIILKIIMVVLVIVFLASGFRTVGPDERALVLRFGKIQGVGEERLLQPGLHWVFPYPIDEIVKIPTEKKVNLGVNSFWYYQTQSELLGTGPRRGPRPPDKLDPLKEGYCLTRSEKRDDAIAGAAGSDYNIVHSKWQLIYQIDDPESFFKNVYVEDIKPGQVYFDVMTKSITPLLEKLVEDAVVTTMVSYTIDDVMFEQVASVTEDVKRLLQEKFNQIEAGIKVISVQLTDKTWPRQVDEAFQAAIKASQGSQKAISEARTYAENTLNEAAGPVAKELVAALHDDSVGEQQEELLWSRVAGASRQRVAEAHAYRTKVVEAAKANAEYLHRILPEYRKRPKLVLQRIYLDAIEEVLSNTDEKVIVQATEGAKEVELRVLFSRDPTLKPKSEQGQATRQD
jgi:membrane protease subunit HflK